MAIDTPLFEPAKIAPPALRRALARPGLIERLAEDNDGARWLQAPSGSGKSTLAHQYAQQRNRPLLWYRLDERDNDPSFFFAVFSATCVQQLKISSALPRFADVDHGREAAFAQRWMRALEAGLPGPVLIVLDDAHRAASAGLLAGLARIITDAPPAVELLLVAEAAPPPALFDAIAARRLSIRNDLALGFTADECAALAASLRLPANAGAEVAALTGGHAGAAVLACELLRAMTSNRLPAAPDAVVQIHRHLLASLLTRLPPGQAQLLLRASVLPRVSPALLAALLARPPREVDAELKDLCERGLLLRAEGDAAAYEMHRLVRDAARLLAAEREGADAVRATAEQAARLLEQDRQWLPAIEVLLADGLVERAAALLPLLAEQCARERHPTLLQNVIAQLPPAVVDRFPWTAYWTGHALLGVNEGEARRWFGRAFRGLEAHGDRAGQAAATASVLVATSLEYVDLTDLDEWRARLRRLREAGAALGGGQRNIWLLAVLADAVMAGADEIDPADAQAALEELRLRVLQEPGWASTDQRVDAARVMIEYATRLLTKQLALQVATETRPLLEREDASALPCGRWLLAVAEAHLLLGDLDLAEATLQQAAQRADACAFAPLRFDVGLQQLLLLLNRDRDTDAQALLAALEADCDGAQPFQRACLGQLATRLLIRTGRTAEAVQRAEAALGLARACTSSPAHSRLFEAQLVLALAAHGRHAEALNRAHVQSRSMIGAQKLVFDAKAAACQFFLSGERDLIALREAWRCIEARTFLGLFIDSPRLAARLAAAALRHGISPDTALRFIRRQRLSAPEDAGPAWPWPIRIRCFSGFELRLDGAPYAPPHKARDKPLALLKALLCAQAVGRASVDKNWLIERLWPDADIDNGRKSLDMAVARLRDLLGRDEAVEVVDGRLRLNHVLVWSDLRDLMQAVHALAQARAGQSAGAAEALRRLTASYCGPFLAGDDETPWLLAARQALARDLRRALREVDTLLARGVDGSDLVSALESALQAEPMDEELTRVLMRVHLAQRDAGSALATYRRAREAMAHALGTVPSAATDAVYRDALAQVAPDAPASLPS